MALVGGGIISLLAFTWYITPGDTPPLPELPAEAKDGDKKKKNNKKKTE